MVETTPISDAVTTFIIEAESRTYDDRAIDHAKRCLVDWAGVSIGGTLEALDPVIRGAAAAIPSDGKARILIGETAAPAVAGLINGTLGHALDYDDTHPDCLGHIGTPCWSTTLALAQQLERSEEEALGAFISGYEVAGALFGPGMGPAIQVRGFHPTSVFGRFAACTAASILLRLNAEQIQSAFGLMATTAAGLIGSLGTMSKPFHAGKAAMDGILSAQLAANGFEAKTDLLDNEPGLASTFVQDKAIAFPDPELTPGHQLKRNAFKPYACCKGTHPTLDAARSLADDVGDGAVDGVTLTVNPMHKRIAGKQNPATPLAAKFSVSYCAAIGLTGHTGFPGDFSDERLANERVMGIENSVTVETDESIGHNQVEISVFMSDGRELEARTECARGNPDNPLSWEDLEAKFLGVAEPVLGAASGELFSTLRHFEKPGSIAAFDGLVAAEPAARAAE
ncbi:MAG: 2-methylcitrate dehydratase [Rhodospirillaceae bacterium]|nr:2-methylcitrate dehydratase [Rhodospirillaceae bacterium]HAA92924.1 MmgE/PrpD family protein [Rhodospirillaceae bacterium]